MPTSFARFVMAIAAVLILPSLVLAASPVTITIANTDGGMPISPVFAGLSYETSLVLPNKDGKYYFRADNQPLLNLYKTLGIRHVRVGGNFSDKPTVPIPGQADIDSLFAFAHAANVKVVYTLRLKGQTDAHVMAPVAKYVLDHYAADLDCFAIGNEPSQYYKSYDSFKKVWGSFMDQIVAVAPTAMFCGPNTDRHYEWAAHFADDFAKSRRIKEINEHAYVGLTARKWVSPDPAKDAELVAQARDLMLSEAWVKLYQGVYDDFVPAVLADKLPYRMEETNTFFNGGVKDASDTFTAALWSLDYLYWWASHQADGINFHTGDTVAAAQEVVPCRYASYWSTPTGYDAHPVGYGVAAFSLGGHGNLVPIVQTGETLNLRTYATVAADGNLCITLINMEHGKSAQNAGVTLAVPAKYVHASIAKLTVAGGDVASKTGLTLGGAAIADDGTWTGGFTDLPTATQGGSFMIDVPASSAAVVKLTAAQ